MDDEAGKSAPTKPKVEIGWMLYGLWQSHQQDAVRRASEVIRDRLASRFPNFDWRLPVSIRTPVVNDARAEPVSLLDIAEFERDSHGWDFVMIFTQSELVTFDRPFAVAVTSRLYSGAVVSTARLIEENERIERSIDRLVSLALLLFGRLNGLRVKRMPNFDTAGQFDSLTCYSDEEARRLRESLASVADLRVEETEGRYRGTVVFYARSLKENRRELLQAIVRMRPWSFPARLRRLITAAGSALLLLMVTAEAWELALGLQGKNVALFSVLALLGTSAYLLKAQRLLARGGDTRLREQRVVRNVGTAIAVCVGMSVTYVAIFTTSLLFGLLLFPTELVSEWAGRHEIAVNLSARAQMAGFASMFGLVLGALGASFEPHGYFRHVTYVDEEI